jgi:flagellar hook-length control protein FliK
LTVAAKAADHKAATANSAPPTPVGHALPTPGNPLPPLPPATPKPEPLVASGAANPANAATTVELATAAAAAAATAAATAANASAAGAVNSQASANATAAQALLASGPARTGQAPLTAGAADGRTELGATTNADGGTAVALAADSQVSSTLADPTGAIDASSRPAAAALLATANGGASRSAGSTAKPPSSEAVSASDLIARDGGEPAPQAVRPTIAASNGRVRASGSAGDAAAPADPTSRGAGAAPTPSSAASGDPSLNALSLSFGAQIQADGAESSAGASGSNSSNASGKTSAVTAAGALFASGTDSTAAAAGAAANANANAAVTPAAAGVFAAALGAADKRSRDGGIDALNGPAASGGSAAASDPSAADGSAAALQANANAPTPAVSDTGTAGLAKIDAGINTPEFSQALADRVSWMAGNNLNGATLQVTPPQLGPIELRVSVENGHAQVWLSAHSPATLDALQSSTPKLREMLSSQGFAQVSVDVSQRSFQDRSAYPQNTPWTPPSENEAAASTAVVGASASPRAALGVVDAYA